MLITNVLGGENPKYMPASLLTGRTGPPSATSPRVSQAETDAAVDPHDDIGRGTTPRSPTSSTSSSLPITTTTTATATTTTTTTAAAIPSTKINAQSLQRRPVHAIANGRSHFQLAAPYSKPLAPPPFSGRWSSADDPARQWVSPKAPDDETSMSLPPRFFLDWEDVNRIEQLPRDPVSDNSPRLTIGCRNASCDNHIVNAPNNTVANKYPCSVVCL